MRDEREVGNLGTICEAGIGLHASALYEGTLRTAGDADLADDATIVHRSSILDRDAI
jgi:hypothetical protein